jgi:rhamnosyltransferase
MTSNPSIAVLLAAYNGMKWIEEQIDSIIKQEDVDIDIYISVDVSSDGTYEWCQNLALKNTKINVLPYGDYFGGAAKNFFRLIRDVDFGNYDYISLADQDDIWLPRKISRAVKLITEGKLDGYSSNVIAFWEDGREKIVKKSYTQKQFDYYFEAAGPGCSYVFKQESIFFFKEFLIDNWIQVNRVELHDWMIYAYFRSLKMLWHIDEVPSMYYRQHEDNQVGVNNGVRAYLNRVKIINNKWYRGEVQKITDLVRIYNKNSIVLSYVFLIKNFYQLRRKPTDVMILLFVLILRVF